MRVRKDEKVLNQRGNPKRVATRVAEAKRKLGVTSSSLSSDVGKFKNRENWLEHWNEFNTALDPNGNYKHKKLRTFAKQITANPVFEDFICWFIGERIADEDETEEQKGWRERFGQPQDWHSKRENGGWFTNDNLNKITRTIAARFNALDAMREVGNTLVGQSLARSEKLMTQLDKEMNGRFFIDNLTTKQNEERTQFYIRTHEQLAALQLQALKRYALCHGINFDDVEALTTLLAGAMRVEAGGGSILGVSNQSTVTDQISAKLSKVAMSKIAAYGLPMPENMANDIVDITAEPTPANKKKNVQ